MDIFQTAAGRAALQALGHTIEKALNPEPSNRKFGYTLLIHPEDKDRTKAVQIAHLTTGNRDDVLHAMRLLIYEWTGEWLPPPLPPKIR